MINLNSDTFTCTKMKFSSKIRNKKPMAYNDLRICFISSGTADWLIDDKKHIVKKGDIILLNNRQKRYFSVFSEDFCVCAIMLKPKAFANTDHLLFMQELIKSGRYIINDEKLLCLLNTVVNESEEKEFNYREIMSVKLTEFFVTLERQFGFDPQKAAKPDKEMLKILDYIDSNIEKHITLSDVSKIANLTESSFSRLFTKLNGISFKRYLMAKRVEKAIVLLENTDMNVIDIAYECGFSSISGFYDAFKKITGTTPNKISTVI